MSNILKCDSFSILYDDKYIVNRKEKKHKKEQKQDISLVQSATYMQAEKILADSRAEAQQIVINAQKQAEVIKSDAYEEGYLDGKTQGYEEGYNKATIEANKKLDTELAKIDRLRKAIYEDKKSIIKQAEKELIRLSLEIAEKIIGIELEDDQKYGDFISNVLAEIKKISNIRLHVSEEDFTKASSSREYIISAVDGLDDLEIISDKYLTPGSCIVDGDIGVIDGSVKTQLKQIEKAFKSIL